MKENLSNKWMIFPVIYPITAVLSYYFNNFLESTYQGLLLTFLFTVGILIIFWLFSKLILRDSQKAAVFIFVCSSLFFTFQNIVHILRELSFNCRNISLLRFWHSNLGQFIVFCVILSLFILVFLMVKKINRINSLIIFYLNIFSVILLFTVIINGVSSINRHNDKKDNFEKFWQSEISSLDYSNHNILEEKPDIYYLIFDGFTRSDVLLELYDLDNSAFISDLESRGFYVAADSYSNYTQTRTSLASSLNLRYLDEAAIIVGEDKSFYFPAYYMINNSVVENTLQSYGYNMVSFRSMSRYADFQDWDFYYQPKFIPDYYSQTFISTTAMTVLLNPQLYRWHFDTVNYVMETLPLTAEIDGPKFIFAHILCPHPPFVFDTDGSLKKADRLFTTQDADHFLSSGTVEEYKLGYRDQVMFLQDAIIELVDGIISKSSGPLIIIIQADHGSGMEFSQDGVERSNLKERLGILNAYYFYDQDYEQLYPRISPVNTFRVVFSQYLDIDFPLLEERHFYTNYRNLFDFVRVDHYLD